MKYQVEKRILHITFEQKERDGKEFQNIYNISKLYEKAEISSVAISGFNFPMKYVTKDNPLYIYHNQADYVISYKNGDRHTKLHELQHAKYYLDEEYKKSVQKLWDSFEESSKKMIIEMLLRMKYANNMDILIDEFQAYYHTEKANFFGKIKIK